MRRKKPITEAERRRLLVQDAARWRYISLPGFTAQQTDKGMCHVFINNELQGVGTNLEKAVDAGIEFQRKKESVRE